MRFLRQTYTIAAKDLRSEIRTKESLNAAISFAIVILVLFSFAVDPSTRSRRCPAVCCGWCSLLPER